MADNMSVSQSGGISSRSKSGTDDELNRIQLKLEPYRSGIVLISKIIEWEPTYCPVVAIGVLTLLFAIMWYMEPSVLSTLSLVGIIFCVAEFAFPLLDKMLIKEGSWGPEYQRHFDKFCSRLHNGKVHLMNGKTFALRLREEKPKMFLATALGILTVTAWIGCLIDNLLLAYLLVVFLVLMPGLRKHGILQKVTDVVTSRLNVKPADKTQ